MLHGLIRLTTVARLLGLDPDTCEVWLARLNYLPIRAPTVGLPDSGARSPRYVSREAALKLVDLLLPKVVDRAARRRAQRAVSEAVRDLEESTRNIRHAVGGGTGSGAPPSNPAL